MPTARGDSRDDIRQRIEAKSGRRRRRRLIVGITVSLTVGVLVGWIALNTFPRADSTALTVEQLPKGADPTTYGIRIGTGAVMIDEYFDPLCPTCKRVARETSSTLADLLHQGRISIIYHPLALLNDYTSPVGYSARAAAAAGCAAESSAFPRFYELLMSRQPAEGGPGLSDEQLIDLAVESGASRRAVAECVSQRRFEPWVEASTDRASRVAGIVATPTILVDGNAISIAEGAAVPALQNAATQAHKP